ncbi:hypothetical protein [Massilia aurea]|uniref:hypothetical protein n=1 Tax=Massilia aurea TaxID=373040 RepID=UPI00351D1E55
MERGQLRPHVDAVYALADMALTHARLESRDVGLPGRIGIGMVQAAVLEKDNADQSIRSHVTP